jgi:hypothetical protein
MKKLRKGILVEVTFIDVASNPAWQSEEERMKVKPTICTYYGVIDHQTAEILYLSSMITDKEADLNEIPTGCITEIWALGYTGKKPIWRKK